MTPIKLYGDPARKAAIAWLRDNPRQTMTATMRAVPGLTRRDWRWLERDGSVIVGAGNKYTAKP